MNQVLLDERKAMSDDRSINLMLLPGLLNDARLWQHQCAALAPLADVRVADLTTAESMAALAESVLAQAPAGPFALAGLSMGGYVALEIMRQAPKRVIALALLDTSARPDTSEARANRHQAIEQAQRDFSQIAPVLMQKQLHPDHLRQEQLVDAITQMAQRIGKDAYIRQQRAIMSRIDSRPFLKDIACPTLVLCGREDRITPLEVHQEMAVAIPAAQLVVVEGSGHLSPLEQPQAVSDAMQLWLESIEVN
jgi:pimeloyl-ACP methyl ester carboxylesterase